MLTVKITSVSKIEGGYLLVVIDSEDMLFGDGMHPARYQVLVRDIGMKHFLAAINSNDPQTLVSMKADLNEHRGTLSLHYQMHCEIKTI